MSRLNVASSTSKASPRSPKVEERLSFPPQALNKPLEGISTKGESSLSKNSVPSGKTSGTDESSITDIVPTRPYRQLLTDEERKTRRFAPGGFCLSDQF